MHHSITLPRIKNCRRKTKLHEAWMQRIAKYNASACIALGSHISSLNSSAGSSIPALSGGGFSHKNHHCAAQLQLLQQNHHEFKIYSWWIQNNVHKFKKYSYIEEKCIQKMSVNLKNVCEFKDCSRIQKISALN